MGSGVAGLRPLWTWQVQGQERSSVISRPCGARRRREPSRSVYGVCPVGQSSETSAGLGLELGLTAPLVDQNPGGALDAKRRNFTLHCCATNHERNSWPCLAMSVHSYPERAGALCSFRVLPSMIRRAGWYCSARSRRCADSPRLPRCIQRRPGRRPRHQWREAGWTRCCRAGAR